MKLFNEKRPKEKLSPYLGASFGKNEIEKLINDYNLKHKKRKYSWKDCAKIISKRQSRWMVSRKKQNWVQDLLGSRSVLADPRNI